MSVLKSIARRLLPRALRNRLRSPLLAARWRINELRAAVPFSVRPDFSLLCPRNAAQHAFNLQVDDPDQVVEFDDFRHQIRGLGRVAFIDVGCHFGIFSFAAIHDRGAAVRVLTVDPSREAAAMVHTIASLNDWKRQLVHLQAAVGEHSGELELVETGYIGAGYLVQPKDHPTSDRVKVPMLPLDELVAHLGEPPTVLKIDVESYELEVILGGARTFSEHRPLLFIELHNTMMRERGVDPALVINTLKRFGYGQLNRQGAALSPAQLTGPDIVRVYSLPDP